MFELIVVLALLVIGLVCGRIAENSHYRKIRLREWQYRELLLFPKRVVPESYSRHAGQLVMGSTVVSVDYFKTFVAGLRNLFGGRVSSFESLLDRARREAILRMQEQARELGAEAVMNLKIETSRVSGDAARGVGSIEILAYGTAMVPRQ
jgi:uncharacterized protein YbjQ (UPF0145 family)